MSQKDPVDGGSDPATENHTVTRLLLAWGKGDAAALEELTPHVYRELRRVAQKSFRGERVDHTLQGTDLVHETYLRLVDQSQIQWQNRAQFFAIAARLMRRILVDHARSRNAVKRGGGHRFSLEDVHLVEQPRDVDLLALDGALEELAVFDPRQAKLVELRYFAGLRIEETALALDISPATVKREWKLAKAWLFGRLAGDSQARSL